MVDTQKRIKNPETIDRLGRQLRQQRERAGIAQSKVRGMRQATVSKIENGGDVTLDTFIAYAASLGLDVALVPLGYATGLANLLPQAGTAPGSATTQAGRPVDLLTHFSDLKDAE